MSILDGYATSEERDYDDMIQRHQDGQCFEDCPVCIEEAYQRDMWERLEDKRKAQEDAKNVIERAEGKSHAKGTCYSEFCSFCIMDTEEQRLLNMSDAEIMEETLREGRDPHLVAEKVRRVIDDAKAKACANAFKPLAINVVKLFKK